MNGVEPEITALYDYEPFGKPRPLALAGGATGEERLTFIDREKDSESQLGDFGVRKYDYELGRFTSTDVLWENDPSFNPYHYSHNNPINLKDETGLDDGAFGTYFQMGPIWENQLGDDKVVTVQEITNEDEPGYSEIRKAWFFTGLLGLSTVLAPEAIGVIKFGLKNHGKETVDDILETSKFVKKTRKNTSIYEKDGGFSNAIDDFNSLKPTDIKKYGNGSTVGRTSDGNIIVVRPHSKDTRPTLEVQINRNCRTKIRYGDKNVQ